MADEVKSESEIREELEALLVRFEDGLAADRDVTPVVHQMLATARWSVDPPRWHATLAEELHGYLGELWPAEDSEPPPMLARCLTAVCEFVLAAPWPDLAWLLLVRADSDNRSTEQVIKDMTAVLAFGAAVDAETRADALMARAESEEERGNEESSTDDWVEAYGLATDPEQRIACACALSVALAKREELLDAAEWAWRAGQLLEQFDPAHDPELGIDIFAAQMAAAGFAHQSGEPIERVRVLTDRMLSRPQWWPEEISGTALHVIRAGVAVEENELPVALDHLGKARQYWDDADEATRTDWHLARAEVAGVLGEVATVEREVRTVAHWIARAGDDQQRERWAALHRWVTPLATGKPAEGGAEDAVTMLNPVAVAVGSGVVEARHLELVDRATEGCDPVRDGPLLVVAEILRAMILVALARLEPAEHALERARERFRILAASPGGCPPQLEAQIETAHALIEFAAGRHEGSARRLESLLERSLSAEHLVTSVVAGIAAAHIYVSTIIRPRDAVRVAVRALTAAQELQSARVASADRLDAARMFGEAHRLAFEAANGLGDPQVMAELLEVARAQAMPRVVADQSMAAGPLGSLLGSLLTAGNEVAIGNQTLEPPVELLPPPVIEMPWGSIALESWLSYPASSTRQCGRLTLDTVA
ncbi:hypothetical protein AB0E69_05865 [Kribbella sp. NPDC026611]|uniref:hypothetical protein n=1 Tax=Kribbella sp. NPDC026611 TaxID=3154911 RepID=UPI0033F7781D